MSTKLWEVQVSDITYIHPQEGLLLLAVVMDLFARNIVGWSMGPRITDGLVLDALTMAYWRRKPIDKVMLHSPIKVRNKRVVGANSYLKH